MRTALISALLTVLLASCIPLNSPSANSDANEVREVVRRYLEAIYSGRAGEAWLMHSQQTNQGESFDDFFEVVQAAAVMGRDIKIERVGDPRIDGDRATVEVVQRLGDRAASYQFSLVREGGRWKIHNPGRAGPGPPR